MLQLSHHLRQFYICEFPGCTNSKYDWSEMVNGVGSGVLHGHVGFVFTIDNCPALHSLSRIGIWRSKYEMSLKLFRFQMLNRITFESFQ